MPGTSSTRATSSIVKEAIFNVLKHRYYVDFECVVAMDLFAGSGALGIEALSLGAKKTIFVDENATSACCIRQNLLSLGLKRQASVICKRLETVPDDIFLKLLAPYRDITAVVFMDPPYKNRQIIISQLSRFRTILYNMHSIFILESNFDVASLMPELTHSVQHGDTFLTFLECGA
jgi:16S rRNA (guanine966-N2)-methyltransferase